MVVAFIALLLALGGASYAAVKLPARSVGSKELKRAAVTRANIKSNAIDGSKVATDTLTGSDIKESSLGQVPSAASAARAAISDRATAASGLDRVAYRTAGGSVGAATADAMGNTVTTISTPLSAGCDPGQVAVGGGVHVEDAASQAVHDSYPSNARTWTAIVGNDDEASSHAFTVYVACIAASTIG
jgi:hypothetical protein